jgi:UDP-N-acetylmuramoyl-tripeptide--D-alanyl-D-alanine ligase
MARTLYTRDELLSATGGTAVGQLPVTIASITIDSRDIGPDALFVAIKGDRFDGHDFVARALADGAACALVSKSTQPDAEPLVVVPDALKGLEALARAARARSRAQIVAVTGSVGKTTTKEALRAVFSAAGETHASLKSFNNHWGVPLTLARLASSADFGVFEIGMNHAGEITPLVGMVRPHIAIVTTIAPAHLEAFGSLEAIADAKAEIFTGLEPGGIALINGDHGQVDRLRRAAEAAGARVVTFGYEPSNDWQISNYKAMGESARADVSHDGQTHVVTIAAAGRHMIANATAALATGLLSGIDVAVALKGLEAFGAQSGRGERQRLGPARKPLLVIDESYNANTASMTAALEVFANVEAPEGRKVIVLGDMLELGDQGPALHAGLADAVIASGADDVYLVGTNMGALAEALGPDRVRLHAPDTDAVAEAVVGGLAYGDAVMVKGSNGIGLSRLIDKIRTTFA